MHPVVTETSSYLLTKAVLLMGMSGTVHLGAQAAPEPFSGWAEYGAVGLLMAAIIFAFQALWKRYLSEQDKNADILTQTIENNGRLARAVEEQTSKLQAMENRLAKIESKGCGGGGKP